MHRTFIGLVIFYSSLLFAQEQHIVFENYSLEQLSSAIVRGMLQDKDGYLWFGTLNAINRFDGFNFKTINYEPANKKVVAGKGYVNAIFEDSKGDLWIGSSGGLNKLNRKTGEISQYLLDNPNVSAFKFDVQCIYEDDNGIYWVGSMMGLYQLDSTGNKLKPFVSQKYSKIISNIAFRAIINDGSGNIWFGTGIGLLKFDKNTDELFTVWADTNISLLNNKLLNSADYAIQSTIIDKSGILWAGSLGGTIVKLNTQSGEITAYSLKDSVSQEEFPVQSICEEDEYSLWIATYNGLILFDKTTGTILDHYIHNENIKESLSDSKLTNVLKDRSGALWIGSLTGGLNKLNKTKIPFRNIVRKSWAADRSYSQVPFSDLIISKNGSLLAGTANGIEEIKPGLKDVILHEPSSPINVLMEDMSGNLWIAVKLYSGGGLYKKDPGGNLTLVSDRENEFSNREIFCIYQMSNGRIFFSSEFNLFEVDPLKNTATSIFHINRRINRISEDIDNILILGTLAGGLYFFDTESKTVIKHFTSDEKDSTSISDNSITEIYLDSKKVLWIGTSTGLNKYIRETGGFKLYNEKSGLAHKLVYKVLEDNAGNLWLGTESGISKLYPETEIFKNYDFSSGLIEGPHYIGAKSKNGEMFFKARTGITYFYPDSVKDNAYIPPVVITEIKVLNNPYPYSGEIELSYSENYISLEFAALSYISQEKNMYAYKMDGVDNDWVSSGNRRYASYTSLEPGKYIFRVKGSNNDGVWNNEGATLSITILPPWYKTYWAYVLYLAIIAFIGYSWRRYDLKRQNLKYQLKMEHENAEKQEEISRMKTRFFTNISHEFRTPLTLIIGPAENILSSTKNPDLQKNAGILKKNAMRLLGLVNQLLDISKLDEGKLKLKVSYGNLVAFVKGVAMLFETYAENKDITLKVKAEKEDIEGYFDTEKMEKVLINVISNAVKFTPEGGRITVNVSTVKDNKALIKVKDTGIGITPDELPKLFDRFYQVDSSQTREHGGTGIGLALTKELIELHKGTISVDSTEGEWTEFTIELPIGSEYYQDKEIYESTDMIFTDIKHPITSEQIQYELDRTPVALNINLSENDIENVLEKQAILVVEDNDEVREYIKESLSEDFFIDEAVNGEQGFRKAEASIPDLIVSDIMMPKMDGYEMTKLLKNDDKTNHIPIILLTAKSDTDSKLEGYDIGADAYIIKPFDTKELKVRITNLINIRKQLQKKFSRLEKIPIKSSEKKLSHINEIFINRVIDIMEKHISEEEFSIEEFGKELCMSRTQLHRKIKALTGVSASRYLRAFRLTEAKKKIENGDGNISEIAYSVGFSSPIYFSKCFKEEFGHPPSEHLTI